ncbi:MAG: porin family protein [bacterium]|nr:porin family protein [bacterium]
MKKALIVLIVFMLSSSALHAQSPTPFKVYLGGGIAPLVGPDNLADSTKLGYGLTLGLGYQMSPIFHIVGKYEYFRINNNLDVDGGTLPISLLGVHSQVGVGMPTSSIQPQVMAGAGVAFVSRSEALVGGEIIVPKANSKSYAYFDVGLGVEVKSQAKVRVFAQARYVHISSENEAITLIPITVGIRLF